MEKINEGEVAVVENTTASPIVNTFDIVDVDAAKKFMENYQDLVEALLVQSDYQQIGDKQFKKKSAWRKLATAFNITDTIIKEEIVRDEESGIVSAKYYVQATLPNGRSSIGVGVCSIFDKIRYKETSNYEKDIKTPSNFILRGRFSNAEHDVPSTAHTRAKNRAISDLIGAGDVSAEEKNEDYETAEHTKESKKVSRGSARKTSEPQSPPKQRRSRRRSAHKKEEKSDVAEEAVIETVAEVVSNDESDDKYEAIENQHIQTAISRLKEDGLEVGKGAISDELFAAFEFGKIDLDEYNAARDELSKI